MHAERMAGKGAQFSSIGDSAVLGTESLNQRLEHLLFQRVAILEREPGGGDPVEYFNHYAASEDGEVSVGWHHVCCVVDGNRHNRDLLLDGEHEGTPFERKHLPRRGA